MTTPSVYTPVHPQKRIRWRHQEADVDQGIASLIRNLWRLDLTTLNSCQDNKGAVWIEFATVRDAERFLDAILTYDDDLQSLYNRVRGAWEPKDWKAHRARNWTYAVHPNDCNVRLEISDDETVEEYPLGPRCHFIFSLSVRFPRSDLPSVEQRVRQALLRHPRALLHRKGCCSR